MRNTLKHLICALALTSCGYNDFDGIHTPQYECLAANADIATVTALYKGRTTVVDEDIVLAGSVTANDRGNNFYRTFIIQDASGAIEVKAGMFSLHNIFFRGRNVAVRIRGLAVDSYNGVIQIGAVSPGNPAQTGYIANRFLPGGYFYPQEFTEEITPAHLSIDRLADELCGMLAVIPELTSADPDTPGLLWAENRTNTFRRFRDRAGREIAVLTSGYADFAGQKIPDEEIELTGILMKGRTDRGEAFFLKLRDLKDVRLM